MKDKKSQKTKKERKKERKKVINIYMKKIKQ